MKVLQVKTFGPSGASEEYERTRAFYESVGFWPLEERTDIRGPENPCLIEPWHHLSMTDRSTGEQSRRRIDASFAFAENVVYVGIAFLLVTAAGVLLVVAGDELLEIRHGLATDPIVEVLDTLLLVFIIVELLSAVRVTVSKRELIAEPFLLVGIIASIKEIVVLSVKAADAIGKGAAFDDQLWQIGVLGVVVVLLGMTAFLLRRKEREPAEGAKSSSSAPT